MSLKIIFSATFLYEKTDTKSFEIPIFVANFLKFS